MSKEQTVCPFGKTSYDSRIFDNLYRVWGDSDGGTILSSYWDGELKMFKVNVGYHIISELIRGSNIGSLCCSYDWVEIDLYKSDKINDQCLRDEIKNHPEQLYRGDGSDLEDYIKKWERECKTIVVPSKKFCMDIASKLPNQSYAELIDNTERIQKYLEETL